MEDRSGIKVRNLVKTYSGGLLKVLDSVTVDIRPGEVFGLIGPNGAGKTTFMGCLLGLLKPDSGEVTCDGVKPDDLSVLGVTGYLPERLNFERWMTGRRFVSFQYELAGLPRASKKQAVESALRRTGLELGAWDTQIKSYSRGMLQRLGLAQAIVAGPKYLFLDEPASGVDPSGVLLVRELINQLKGEGTTVIVNSHQLDQIEKVCDRVVFLKQGKIQAVESLTDQSAGRELVVRFLSKDSVDKLNEEFVSELSGTTATLIECRGERAGFLVDGDQGAYRLLKSLMDSGLEVVEAAPPDGRLEKYFHPDTTSGKKAGVYE